MRRDFVDELLAIAEAARYGQGVQRLQATVIVFKMDLHTPPEVDRAIVRRALALIASKT